jgi:hypothetical protein
MMKMLGWRGTIAMLRRAPVAFVEVVRDLLREQAETCPDCGRSVGETNGCQRCEERRDFQAFSM